MKKFTSKSQTLLVNWKFERSNYLSRHRRRYGEEKYQRRKIVGNYENGFAGAYSR